MGAEHGVEVDRDAQRPQPVAGELQVMVFHVQAWQLVVLRRARVVLLGIAYWATELSSLRSVPSDAGGVVWDVSVA